MATDNSNNAPGTQAEMDDILSSIRSTMAEEGAKVGSGSADLIEAAAAQDAADEDILDLAETDMVAGDSGEEADELIDLDAFANSGEQKTVAPTDAAALAADILGEQAEIDEITAANKPADVVASASSGEAADEFDRLLAEISQEQQQQVVASEISKQALMDEEEPLGGLEDESSEENSDDVSEPVATENLAEAVTEELVTAAAPVMTSKGKASFDLGMVDGPNGVQIAFPAEVLAMALRPMVQEWLTKNLPAVVERLVKDEISKLTQN
ncbi:MAG: hypothetical protein DI585_05515 [Pseudomonas fluorescens]|nr:MAG: hypothetical protein DI585_05515 [Pseudomonas fluorescens]